MKYYIIFNSADSQHLHTKGPFISKEAAELEKANLRRLQFNAMVVRRAGVPR